VIAVGCSLARCGCGCLPGTGHSLTRFLAFSANNETNTSQHTMSVQATSHHAYEHEQQAQRTTTNTNTSAAHHLLSPPFFSNSW
jgi:hypothetical protein